MTDETKPDGDRIRRYAQELEQEGSEPCHLLASAYLARDDEVVGLRARVAELEADLAAALQRAGETG